MKHTRKFSKMLALMLSLLMMLTMIPLSVSAEASTEATAITSAAEFAAMTEDGNYYLANSIIITETYAKTFKGTFDGRGNVITTTATLFKTVDSATIENLTVAGQIRGRATVTSYIVGNTTFSNVTNVASVNGSKDQNFNFDMVGDYSDSVTSNNTTVGGIAGCVIGSTEEGTKVSFINCKNTAAITVSDSTGDTNVGGILGGALFNKIWGNAGVAKKVDVEFINCTNSGVITSVTNGGGILGQAYDAKTITLVNCVNTGKITYGKTDKKSALGGLVGYANIPAFLSWCYNTAEIVSTDLAAGVISRPRGGGVIQHCWNIAPISTIPTELSGYGEYGGGILAYDNNSEIDILYCYNTGNITSNKYVGGIAGRMNNISSDVVGCYSSGTIALNEGCTDGKLGQIFQGGNYGTLLNNYYDKAQSDSGIRAYYLKGLEIDNADAVPYETADIASGKLAYDMNKAIGAQVYYQNLTDTDAAKNPTLNSDDGAVIKSGDNYYSVRIETEGKAAVRIDGEKSGLRVTTQVNKADYDKLIAAGISANDLTFGTVFAPDSYVGAVGEAGGMFSMAHLEQYLVDLDTTYVDVPVANKGAEGFYATDAAAYHFRGSLVNIAKDNLGDSFSAIGYIKLGEDIIYSGYYVTVSIAEIAEMAYEDRADVADTTYTQTIAASSEVAIGAVVTYSPYTEAQLKTLKGYYN